MHSSLGLTSPHPTPHHPATQTHSPALDPTWGPGTVEEGYVGHLSP